MVFGFTFSISIVYPEVSILPPFPIFAFAYKFPLAIVFELKLLTSDQITIFPPSPTPKELTSIRESFSTVV